MWNIDLLSIGINRFQTRPTIRFSYFKAHLTVTECDTYLKLYVNDLNAYQNKVV